MDQMQHTFSLQAFFLPLLLLYKEDFAPIIAMIPSLLSYCITNEKSFANQ